MRCVYYVDLENVQASGLEGVGDVKKGDVVYVFYSAHAKPRIPFETAQELTHCQGDFIFKEVVNLGKDAMDNEIIKSAKKHMKKHHNCSYIIISKDKGYRKVFKNNLDVAYSATIRQAFLKK